MNGENVNGANVNVRRGLALAVARFGVAVALFGAGAVLYRYGLGQAHRPPLWSVIAISSVVATAEWVLRDRLELLVNRVVLGQRASRYELMQDLLEKMASTLPIDEVVPRLAEAAGRTVRRPRAEVRMWLADGQRWSQVWPLEAPPSSASLTLGVRYAGEAVGEIDVEIGDEEITPFDRRLLDELSRPAGVALSTVRLTVELRQRAVELIQINAALSASSERLLNARRIEQRRVERVVADRIVPNLAAAQDALSGAALTPVDSTATKAIADAVAVALDELRELARGIFPPQLSHDGLATSLDGWAQRAQAQVQIVIAAPSEELRVAEVDTGLYFCAVTALESLAGQRARALYVRVEVVGEQARLEVGGHGVTAIDPDVLLAVRDRISAFDGTVEVDADETEEKLAVIGRVPLAVGR